MFPKFIFFIFSNKFLSESVRRCYSKSSWKNFKMKKNIVIVLAFKPNRRGVFKYILSIIKSLVSFDPEKYSIPVFSFMISATRGYC